MSCGNCHRNHQSDYEYLYTKTESLYDYIVELKHKIEDLEKVINRQKQPKQQQQRKPRFPQNKFKKLHKRLKRLEQEKCSCTCNLRRGPQIE